MYISTLPSNLRCLLLGTSALTGFALASTAQAGQAALPTNGVVTVGSATIAQPSASQLNITTGTNRTVIDWQSFSIANGNKVVIQQPGSSAITVNEVTGADPSQIFGDLSSNGRVVLTNPNGIWFGPNAHVDVAGLVASTASLSADAKKLFAAGGRLSLDTAGNPTASIVNDGRITIAGEGLAALVAPGVRNNGVIEATLGSVTLASGQTSTLDFYGDGLVSLAVTSPVQAIAIGPDGKPFNATIESKGKIAAAHVLVTADVVKGVVDNAINMSGVVEAKGVTVSGGDIVLDGGDGGVTVAGTLDATSQQALGGNIAVTGGTVTVAATAQIDASGAKGGGTIQVGGGPQGGGTLKHALTVLVQGGSAILANATAQGGGGTVSIWSDRATTFNGSVQARGAGIGNGGWVETSSEGLLTVGLGAMVDTLAPNGKVGTWLLDPNIIVVANGGGATLGSAGTTTDTTSTITIAPATIDAAASNVVLSAATSITVNNDINIANPGVGITFEGAGSSVATGPTAGTTLNANVTTNNGAVQVMGGLIIGTNATISTGTAPITLGAVDDATPNTDNLTLSGGTVNLGGVVGNDGRLSSLYVSGASILVEGIITTNSGQTFNGPVVLTSNTTFSNTTGVVLFKDTLDGPFCPTFPNATVEFDKAVGSKVPLAGVYDYANVTKFGGPKTNPVTFTANGNEEWRGGGIVLYQDTVIRSNNGSLFFTENIDSSNGTPRSLVLASSNYIEQYGAIGSAHALDNLTFALVNPRGSLFGNITGTLTEIFPSQQTALSGTVNFDSIVPGHPITLVGDTTITAANESMFLGGAIDGTNAGAQMLTLLDPGNIVAINSIGGTTNLAGLTVTGGVIMLNSNVVNAKAQRFNGPVILGTSTTLSAAGPVTFTSTIDATTSGTETLTISDASGPVTLGGAIGGGTQLSSLTVTGEAISLGAGITLANVGSFAGPVTLAADTTVAATNGTYALVHFQNTVNGAHALTVSVQPGPDSTLLFDQTVGGATPLASLNLTSGSINLGMGSGGASIFTTGDQTTSTSLIRIYNDAVLRSQAGNISIAETEIEASGTPRSLVISANGVLNLANTTIGASGTMLNNVFLVAGAISGPMSVNNSGTYVRVSQTTPQSFGGAVDYDAIRPGGAITLSGDTTITATGENMVLSGPVNGTTAGAQMLMLSDPGSNIAINAPIGGTTKLGTVTLNTSGDGVNTGVVTQTAPINTNALELTGTGANFILTSTLNNVGTLAANAGSVTLNNGGNPLTIGEAGGTTGITLSGNLALSGVGSTLTVYQNVSVSGPGGVDFTEATTGAAEMLIGQNSLTISTSGGTGAINLGAINGTVNLTLNASSGTINLGGVIGGTVEPYGVNETSNAGIIIGANITTLHGDQFIGPVTLATDAIVTLSDSSAYGQVHFSSTVDGAHALTINAQTSGSAVVQFDQTVGGSTPLTSLRVTGPSVQIGNGGQASITTTGDQTFTTSEIRLIQNGVIRSQAGNISITDSSIDASNGSQTIVLSAHADLNLGGTALGSNSALSAITEVSDTLEPASANLTGQLLIITTAGTPQTINGMVPYDQIRPGGTIIVGSSTINNGTITATGENMNLTGPIDGFSAGSQLLTLSDPGSNIAINAPIGGTTKLGTVTVNTSGDGVTTGVVTQTAPIKTTALELTGGGGNFVLTNTLNNVGTLAANTGSVTLNDGGHPLTIAQAGGSTGITLTGNLSLSGLGSTLTLYDNVSVSGPGGVDFTEATTGAAQIVIGQNNLTIDTSGGTGPINLGAINGPVNLNINAGTLISSGTIGLWGAIGGTVEPYGVNEFSGSGIILGANITTAHGDQFFGPVTLAVDTTISLTDSSSYGQIHFSSTVDGAHALTVMAQASGSSVFQVDQTIGGRTPLTSLNATAPSVQIGNGGASTSISTTGDLSINAIGGTVLFQDVLMRSQAGDISITNTAFQAGGGDPHSLVLSASGNLDLTNTTGTVVNVTLVSDTLTGSPTFNHSGTLTTITTNGTPQQLSGPVDYDMIRPGGALTLIGDTTISSSGETMNFTGPIDGSSVGAQVLTLSDPSFNIAIGAPIGGTTSLKSFTATAAGMTLGRGTANTSITTQYDQHFIAASIGLYHDAMLRSQAGSISLANVGLNPNGNSILLSASANLDLSNVTNSGAFNNVTLVSDRVVGTSSFAHSGTLTTITTMGTPQQFSGPVDYDFIRPGGTITLTGDTTITATGETMNLSGPIDGIAPGGQMLTLGDPGFNIAINNAVGGVVPLSAFSVGATTNMLAVNAPVTTAGTLGITLAATGQISTGPGGVLTATGGPVEITSGNAGITINGAINSGLGTGIYSNANANNGATGHDILIYAAINDTGTSPSALGAQYGVRIVANYGNIITNGAGSLATARPLFLQTQASGSITIGANVTAASQLTLDAAESTMIGGTISDPGPGTVTLNDTIIVTQTAPIEAGHLRLIGGASFDLNGVANNQVGTIAANAGSVTLDNGGNSLTIGTAGGTVGITLGGDLTLINLGTLTLAANIQTGGSGGVDLSAAPEVLLAQNVTIDTSSGTGGILLPAVDATGVGTLAQALTLISLGTITLAGDIGDQRPLGALSVTGSTLYLGGSGPLAITSIGEQDFTGNVVLSQNATLTSTTSNLHFFNKIDGAVNLTLSAGDTVFFDDDVGGQTAFNTLTVTGIFSPYINTTTTGNQTYNDETILWQDSHFTSTNSGSIHFGGLIDTNGSSEAFSVTTGGVASFDSGLGTNSVPLTTVDITAATINLAHTIYTSGNQTYTGPVRLAADVDAISTAGNISFTSTIDNTQALAISALNGDVTIGGNVGAQNPLFSFTLNALTLNGSDSYGGSSPTITVNNGPPSISLSALTGTLNNSSYSSARTLLLNGTITLGTDVTITVTGGDIDVTGTIDGSHSLTLIDTATGGTLRLMGAIGGNTALTSLSLQANNIVVQAPITATGTVNGLVMAGGSFTIAAAGVVTSGTGVIVSPADGGATFDIAGSVTAPEILLLASDHQTDAAGSITIENGARITNTLTTANTNPFVADTIFYTGPGGTISIGQSNVLINGGAGNVAFVADQIGLTTGGGTSSVQTGGRVILSPASSDGLLQASVNIPDSFVGAFYGTTSLLSFAVPNGGPLANIGVGTSEESFTMTQADINFFSGSTGATPVGKLQVGLPGTTTEMFLGGTISLPSEAAFYAGSIDVQSGTVLTNSGTSSFETPGAPSRITFVATQQAGSGASGLDFEQGSTITSVGIFLAESYCAVASCNGVHPTASFAGSITAPQINYISAADTDEGLGGDQLSVAATSVMVANSGAISLQTGRGGSIAVAGGAHFTASGGLDLFTDGLTFTGAPTITATTASLGTGTNGAVADDSQLHPESEPTITLGAGSGPTGLVISSADLSILTNALGGSTPLSIGDALAPVAISVAGTVTLPEKQVTLYTDNLGGGQLNANAVDIPVLPDTVFTLAAGTVLSASTGISIHDDSGNGGATLAINGTLQAPVIYLLAASTQSAEGGSITWGGTSHILNTGTIAGLGLSGQAETIFYAGTGSGASITLDAGATINGGIANVAFVSDNLSLASGGSVTTVTTAGQVIVSPASTNGTLAGDGSFLLPQPNGGDYLLNGAVPSGVAAPSIIGLGTGTGGNLELGQSLVSLFGGSAGAPVGLLQIGLQGSTAPIDLAGHTVLPGATTFYGGGITLTGDTSLSLAGATQFGGAINGGYNLTLDGSQGGTASLSSVGTTVALASLVSDMPDGLSVSGTIRTTGGQSYAGVTTLAGNTTLMSTGGGTIGITGTVDGTVAGSQELAILGAGAVQLGGTIGGTVALFEFSDAAPILLTADTKIATGFSILISGSVDGAHALELDDGAQATVALTGGVGAATPLSSLTVNAATAFDVAGPVDTTGNQTYHVATGGVVLASGAFFHASVGNIHFYTPINGAQALSVFAGGSVEFDGAIGSTTAVNSFALTAGSLVGSMPSITATGIVAINPGIATLSGTYSFGSFNDNAALTLAGNTQITTTGTLSLGGTVDGAHALTLDAGTVASLSGTVGGTAALSSLSVAGSDGITLAGAVNTTGNQSYTGTTTLAGTASSGGAFTVTGTTLLGGSETISATGGITFGGPLVDLNPRSGTLTLAAGGSDIAFNGLVGNSSASGGALGAVVITSARNVVGPPINSTALANGTPEFTATSFTAGSAATPLTGSVTLAGGLSTIMPDNQTTITTAGSVFIDAAGAISIGTLNTTNPGADLILSARGADVVNTASSTTSARVGNGGTITLIGSSLTLAGVSAGGGQSRSNSLASSVGGNGGSITLDATAGGITILGGASDVGLTVAGGGSQLTTGGVGGTGGTISLTASGALILSNAIAVGGDVLNGTGGAGGSITLDGSTIALLRATARGGDSQATGSGTAGGTGGTVTLIATGTATNEIVITGNSSDFSGSATAATYNTLSARGGEIGVSATDQGGTIAGAGGSILLEGSASGAALGGAVEVIDGAPSGTSPSSAGFAAGANILITASGISGSGGSVRILGSIEAADNAVENLRIAAANGSVSVAGEIGKASGNALAELVLGGNGGAIIVGGGISAGTIVEQRTSGSLTVGGNISVLTYTSPLGNDVLLTFPGFAAGSAINLGGTFMLTGAGSFGTTAMTLLGSTVIDTSTNNSALSIGSIDGAFDLTINAGTGAASINAIGHATPLSSVAVDAGTANLGSVSTTGAQTYVAATTLGGTYAASALAVTGPTLLSIDTAVTAGAGGIRFGGTIDGGQALTLTDTAGTVTLAAAVGSGTPLGSLTINAGTISVGSVVTTHGQVFNGTTQFEGTYTGGSFAASGADVLMGATSITVTSGGALGFVGSVDGGQALTLNDTSGAVTLGGSVGANTALGSLTVTGGSVSANSVTTTGAQSYGGTTSLSGNFTAASFTATNGNVAFGGSIDGAQSLALAATNGTISVAGAVGGQTALSSLTLGGTGQTVDFSGSVTTAHLTDTRSSGALTVAGGLTTPIYSTAASNDVLISITGGSGPLSLAGEFDFTTALNLSARPLTLTGKTVLDTSTNNNSLTLGTVDGAFGLTLNAGTGVVTAGPIGGKTALSSLTINAGATSLTNVTTTGAQSYTGTTTFNGTYIGGGFTANGADLLGAATGVTVSGGNIGFGGTLNGAQSLVLTDANGTVSFAGAVGGSAALASLTVSANGIVAGSVATSGAQSYTGPITVGGTYKAKSFTTTGPVTMIANTAINSGTGDMTFGSTVQGQFNLALASTNANIFFDGTVGLPTARLTLLSITGANNATVLNNSSLWVHDFTASNIGGTLTFGNHSLESDDVVTIQATSVDGRVISTTSTTINATSVSGIIQGSSVNVTATGAVNEQIVADTASISGGSFDGSVAATRGANIAASGDVNGTISVSGGGATVSGANIGGSVTSSGLAQITATQNVSADVTGGSVAIQAGQTVSGNVTATGGSIGVNATTVSSTIMAQSGGQVDVTASNSITGSVSGGQVNLTAPTISETVSAAAANITGSNVTVTGSIGGADASVVQSAGANNITQEILGSTRQVASNTSNVDDAGTTNDDEDEDTKKKKKTGEATYDYANQYIDNLISGKKTQ